jgi:MFS family permease
MSGAAVKRDLWGPLRSIQFAQLIIGQFVSGIGDGIFLIALVEVMVTQRDSARDLGIILGVRSLVSLSAVIFGGVISDRFRRIHVMAITDAARMVVVLGAAFLPSMGPLGLWIVIAGLMGVGSAAFQPAYLAVVPSLVPSAQLQNGNALKMLAQRGALIIGPSAGALVLSFSSPRIAFLIDAGTFAVSLVSLIRIAEPPLSRRAKANENILRSAALGFRTVLDRPWLAWLIGSATIQIFFVIAPLTVLIPIYLQSRHDTNLYGVVSGLRSAGIFAGIILAAGIRPRRSGLVAMCGTLTLLALFVPLIFAVPTWVMFVAAFVAGTGPSLFVVYWPTAIQRAVPETLRGRVFAVDQLGAYGLQPLSLALTPLAVTAVGVPAVAFAGAAVLIVT